MTPHFIFGLAGLRACATFLAALMLSCAPREIIPVPSGGEAHMLSCALKPNCGQCLSDQRCAICVQSDSETCVEVSMSCAGILQTSDPSGSFCASAHPLFAGDSGRRP